MTNGEDAYERLREAADAARVTLQRVASEGSLLEALQGGDWDAKVTPGQANDLADLLGAMGEHVRRTGAVAGGIGEQDLDPSTQGVLSDLLAGGLPLNRKERYYTGTVLPMIVASDGFAHLDRILRLCALPSAGLQGNPLEGYHPVAFYTEYNFAESRFTDADRARFPDAPTDADTPDVVIAGPDWLLCIEAKVFHDPRPDALNAQMARQRVLVDYWSRALDLDPARVAHVLLLPAGLDTTGVADRVVTWESVLSEYRIVGPAYWVTMLETALVRYNELVSPSDTYGKNAEDHLSGIVIQSLSAEKRAIALMGRTGGLDGAALQADLTSGKWRTHKYEVRYSPLPGNANWFPVESFLTRLPKTGPGGSAPGGTSAE